MVRMTSKLWREHVEGLSRSNSDGEQQGVWGVFWEAADRRHSVLDTFSLRFLLEIQMRMSLMLEYESGF